jgi:GTP-binding protein Era
VSAPEFKCGFVGIVGRPNVGKSTLVNRFLKFKLSIVTPKPQTTRHRILGVLNGEGYQIVFLDTPGIMSDPRYELQKIMVHRAVEVIDESDLVVYMADPEEPHPSDEGILDVIRRRGKTAILAINKVDTVRKDLLLPVIEDFSKRHPFAEIVPISAIRLDGTDDLLDAIVRHLPAGEPFYEEDVLTDRPERFFAAEIVREKVFEACAKEIPYSTSVEIEEFRESDEEGRKDFIRAVVYVERDSQKRIVIGKGGSMLRRIGAEAREDIEALLDRKVYLELWVKVREAWRKDKRFLKESGY